MDIRICRCSTAKAPPFEPPRSARSSRAAAGAPRFTGRSSISCRASEGVPVLLELSVRNFALVDQVSLRWAPGLNVLTGETGAGKSILVDAVSALMGSRMGVDWVRTGADQATVEGIFELPEAEAEPGADGQSLEALLAEYDLLPEGEH